MSKGWLVYLPDFDEVLPQVFHDYEEAKGYAEELQDAIILPFPDLGKEREEEEEDEWEEEGPPDFWADSNPGGSEDGDHP